MAKDCKMSDESVNAQANAWGALANSGKLRIYSGTKPATADTAIGAQVLLAELTMNAAAFGAAVAGVLTAAAITSGVGTAEAGAGTTATWYRLLKSNGTSPLKDGTVGLSDSDLVLTAVSIATGVAVGISSMTHTVPKAGA
jgi:hypothetical protein